MIKTITLAAGVETTVAISKKYALVKNMGSTAVYVCKTASITADADGVQCILPQTAELVKDISLTSVDLTTNTDISANVYFLCSANTKIEMQISDDANFKKFKKGGEKLILERKYTVAELKTLNTVGVWAGDVYVEKGITFTFTTDLDYTIKSISLSGTCSTTFNFTLRFQETAVELLTPNQQYLLTGCPTAGAEATYTLRLQQYKDNGDWFANHFDNGVGLAIKPLYSRYNLVIRVGTGVVLSNAIYTPRLYKVLF